MKVVVCFNMFIRTTNTFVCVFIIYKVIDKGKLITGA